MTGAGAPYEAVIFDLDGTLFRGRTAIPGAVDAVNRLREGVACRFLSNNGERRAATLADRLRSFGFTVEPHEIISSADIVIEYVAGCGRRKRILALTSDELAAGLASCGHEIVDSADADVVVIGVDRSLTRERMVRGLRAALQGAGLVATNEDPTYPAQDGLRPAAGAYVGFFRGMGFEPARLCGKPDPWAVLTALDRWEIGDPSSCLFVGDNLGTDIAAADAVGADSVLVLTGVSRAADIAISPAKPTATLTSVRALSWERILEVAEGQPGCGAVARRGRES